MHTHTNVSDRTCHPIYTPRSTATQLQIQCQTQDTCKSQQTLEQLLLWAVSHTECVILQGSPNSAHPGTCCYTQVCTKPQQWLSQNSETHPTAHIGTAMPQLLTAGERAHSSYLQASGSTRSQLPEGFVLGPGVSPSLWIPQPHTTHNTKTYHRLEALGVHRPNPRGHRALLHSHTVNSRCWVTGDCVTSLGRPLSLRVANCSKRLQPPLIVLCRNQGGRQLVPHSPSWALLSPGGGGGACMADRDGH